MQNPCAFKNSSDHKYSYATKKRYLRDEICHSQYGQDRNGTQQCCYSLFYFEKNSVKNIEAVKRRRNCVKKKRGPKFKLSEAAIQVLQRILLKNNKKPLFVTVNEFRINYGYKLSIKTVCKQVYNCGLRNYAAVPKPYLIPRHVLARKGWANMHLNWDISQ